MTPNEVEQIDVEAVLSQRAPGVRRMMPRFLVRWLEHWICQDEINETIAATHGLRDAQFCHKALKHVGVDYEVVNNNLLGTDARVTIVSNHPLGALDGICLIDAVSAHFNSPVKFPVNDLLMAVKPLEGTFVPVNKHGAQSRAGVIAVDEAFASDLPVLMFPAGLCSRKGADGKIADLEWKKMFVQKSLQHGRRIIPVHFDGENSKFFYNFARLRQRLGIRFNLEMLCLPREIFRNRNRQFRITVGETVDPSLLMAECGGDAAKCATLLKQIVYSLRK